MRASRAACTVQVIIAQSRGYAIVRVGHGVQECRDLCPIGMCLRLGLGFGLSIGSEFHIL
jgi:hypothetical protein